MSQWKEADGFVRLYSNIVRPQHNSSNSFHCQSTGIKSIRYAVVATVTANAQQKKAPLNSYAARGIQTTRKLYGCTIWNGENNH